MIERSAAFPALWGRLNRLPRIRKSAIDCRFKWPAKRKACRDRCRQSAASSVSVSYRMFRCPPGSLGVGRNQEIFDVVSSEVPTLDQNSPAAEREDSRAGFAHRVGGPDLHVRQDFGFVEVGRDQIRHRNETACEGIYSRQFEEGIPSGRDHHGIKHVVWDVSRLESHRDGIDDRVVSKHAGFARSRSKVACHRFDLGRDQARIDSPDGPDFSCVLGRNRRDRGGSEHAEFVKGLEVCLNARTTTGVTSRNRQSYRPLVLMRHGVTHRYWIHA